MARTVRVAAIQPPVPANSTGYQAMVECGLERVRQAGQAGAQAICLPEYFGVFGLPTGQWRERIQQGDRVLDACRELASRFGAVVVCPSIELDGGCMFNTAWVVGADGRLVGGYRKVHLTKSERTDTGLTAGNAYPVFTAGPLRFGVMTCYDAYFPEAARLLALGGAQLIFWPSLQRSTPDEMIYLQARARAFDNCVCVARSSYGHPRDASWRPGLMPGDSCLVESDGRIVADLGHEEGLVVSDLHLEPRPRRRSHNGRDESPRDYLYEDRRPDTYGGLCV